MLLLHRVEKPALLRQLFALGCAYSAEVLSYQKMLGQLRDARNTTTLAGYLQLLSVAGLLAGLPARYARQMGEELPEVWKYGYPTVHPETRDAWRTWLSRHHRTARGVWVASWRKETGRAVVAYPEQVEEALCFGWIDSMTDTLDAERGLQMFTPRRPRSTWTRLNRERVARLEAQGRMVDAGRRAVEVAKANGWWTIYDPVEDLREPAELATALDAAPRARREWDAFPPSARKAMLWWVISAARPETRDRRIAAIVVAAEEGRRAQG